jgi:hypothetical protein
MKDINSGRNIFSKPLRHQQTLSNYLPSLCILVRDSYHQGHQSKGDNHSLSNNLNLALQHSVDFFDKYLKNEKHYQSLILLTTGIEEIKVIAQTVFRIGRKGFVS